MQTLHSAFSRLARLSLCLALAGATIGAQRPAAAAAPAAALLVDRSDDASGLPCGAPINDCTLRSAIQIANTNGVDDLITFSTSMTITYLSAGQPLTATGTTIRGAPGQRISIDADNTGNVFRIRANDITLDGLRMYGSAAGNSIIWISDAAQRIKIANNVIGDDDPGFVGTCNNSLTAYGGIYINASANPAGSDALAWIYGNSIKCAGGLPGHGITVDGSREVVIGADALGNTGFQQFNLIQLNAGDGAHLQGGATANIIRNSALQYNNGNGLVIDDSNNNRAYGIYFQVNHKSGVVHTNTAQLNQIGCPLGTLDPNDPDLVNHIQQNYDHGVLISGASTNSNLILCNLIGADDDLTPDAGNQDDGIRIDRGARFNVIGVNAGTRNVISANNGLGLSITGAGTNSNLVQGNYIGTTISGTAALPNGISGVGLFDGASLNTIGGAILSSRNVIAGNTGWGVLIGGASTATNTVSYNDLGFNGALGGVPLPNSLDGIIIIGGAHHNIIGGTGTPNLVAYNGGSGLLITDGAHSNSIFANAVFSNSAHGVRLTGPDTALNIISNTVIFHNGLDGISERNDAGLNVWTHISTFHNGGLGIDKNADSAGQNIPDAPFPVITAVNAATGQITGTASAFALVEVYRAYPNWSGMGEGRIFEGSAISDGSGNWSLSVAPGGSCYTAFQTVGFIIYASSEFGPNTCRVFAPVTVR
jgi:hypothetical protein